MGTLNKTVLGRVTGAVGDIVFRSKNGKNYVSSKPANVKVSNSQIALAARAKFRICIKFAQAVAYNQMIKSLWLSAKPQYMSAANFIFRTNYTHITSTDVSNSASLVPGFGFSLVSPVIDINSTRLRVTLDAITADSGINPATEPNLRLAAVLVLTSPLNSGMFPYDFIPLSSPEVATVFDTPVNFTANLNSQQAQLFSQYQTVKAFCTIVSLNSENSVVHFATTFVG